MRHMLVPRFLGDDATFLDLPDSNPDYVRNGLLCREEMAKLNDGDTFCSPIFHQVV